MSGDRDELARLIAEATAAKRTHVLDAAYSVWAAGWRKMPSRETLADFISEQRDAYPRSANDMDSEELADAILSLMGGVSEQTEQTGEQ